MSSVPLFNFMQSYFLKISIQCCCRINFQLKIYFCHMAHILTKWPTSWHSQHKVLKFCLMKLKRTKNLSDKYSAQNKIWFRRILYRICFIFCTDSVSDSVSVSTLYRNMKFCLHSAQNWYRFCTESAQIFHTGMSNSWDLAIERSRTVLERIQNFL